MVRFVKKKIGDNIQMADKEKLYADIQLARRELKNIRQECLKQRADLKSEVKKIQGFLSKGSTKESCTCEKKAESRFCMTPIGFISSCFKSKNGIPRQSALCPAAKGTLIIEKEIFTNPEHSLIGLNEFSHIWILFIFHQNGSQNAVKAKVHPPRLNGTSVGVFSTRSPHRPCAIGLSLIKLDKIEGRTLFLSGIDLLDGTPVLDIKPYIPLYDAPPNFKENKKNFQLENEEVENEGNQRTKDSSLPLKSEGQIADSSVMLTATPLCYSENKDCRVSSFLAKIPEHLDVFFTNRALDDLGKFHSKESHESFCEHCFSFESQSEAKQAISDVLKHDPRSVYRRTKCSDRLYYFFINNLHITCWFDENIAEVLRIKSCTNGNENMS